MATAVVVGAGIGGLSAAIGLRRRGWDVTVLERAPRIEAVGAGLTLLANGLRALDALGVGEAVRAQGQVEAAGGLRTPDGTWLTRVDGAAMTRALGTTAIGIHRATLHRVLADALPPGTLVLGVEVAEVLTGASPRVDGGEVGTDQRPRIDGGEAGTGPGPRVDGGDVGTGPGPRVDGGDVGTGPGPRVDGGDVVVGRRPRVDGREVDLVVAADGINSAVRRRLWPGVPGPVYAGSTAWRGVTAEAWTGAPLVGITWGEGAEFGMVPLGDGRAYWFGAVTSPPGAWHDDELAAVRERFGHWHHPIPALMAASDTVLRDDIYQLATPLPSYVDGGVVLLGDAAHAMTPNLGQGANQALEDAVVLASLCDPAADLGPALAAYDAQRRPRSQAVARAAYQMGRFGQQLRNPVAVALRNTLIRLTPPRAGLRSMIRYADWTPPELP